MKKVILISGKAESGKDTVANFILMDSQEVGSNACKHLASPIKRIAKEIGWDGVKDEKGRALLQFLGNGIRDTYDSSVWIKLLLKEMEAEDNALVVIPDVRYKNEYTEILDWCYKHKVAAYTVRVERPNHKNKLTPEQQNHKSETDLDDVGVWDFKVVNDGTLEELKDTVLNMMELMHIDYKPEY